MLDCFKPTPELLQRIGEIVVRRGMKATKMDDLAKELGVSKRTLYEKFDSKTDMIRQVIRYQSEIMHKIVEGAFRESENVLEAMLIISRYQRATLTNVHADFYRDMDDLFAELRPDYDVIQRKRFEDLMRIISKGIDQGVFRADVDYRINIRLMAVQLESLKRMEEFFPADITLAQAFDAITDSFLRSIVSAKGQEMLNNLKPNA